MSRNSSVFTTLSDKALRAIEIYMSRNSSVFTTY